MTTIALVDTVPVTTIALVDTVPVITIIVSGSKDCASDNHVCLNGD